MRRILAEPKYRPTAPQELVNSRSIVVLADLKVDTSLEEQALQRFAIGNGHLEARAMEGDIQQFDLKPRSRKFCEGSRLACRFECESQRPDNICGLKAL